MVAYVVGGSGKNSIGDQFSSLGQEEAEAAYGRVKQWSGVCGGGVRRRSMKPYTDIEFLL